MNKSTLRTILATVAVMILLFRLAVRNNWLNSNGNLHQGKKPNKHRSYTPPQPQSSNKRDNSNTHSQASNTNNNNVAHNTEEVQQMHLLDHERKIILTKHAQCRMECRHFTNEEVKEILQNGTINFDKSNDREGSCPTYAIEGETHDGQHARMVFAFCDYNTAKVITVIDLDTDWKCNCY